MFSFVKLQIVDWKHHGFDVTWQILLHVYCCQYEMALWHWITVGHMIMVLQWLGIDDNERLFQPEHIWQNLLMFCTNRTIVETYVLQLEFFSVSTMTENFAAFNCMTFYSVKVKINTLVYSITNIEKFKNMIKAVTYNTVFALIIAPCMFCLHEFCFPSIIKVNSYH